MSEPARFVSDIATAANVNAKLVTQLFYTGVLDTDRCPVVSGRRMVPESYFREAVAVVKEYIARRERRAAAV